MERTLTTTVSIALAFVMVIAGTARPAVAQQADSTVWTARTKSSGANPLLTTKPWPTEAGSGTTAYEQLKTLLSSDDHGAPILDPTRNYVVLVAGAGWNDVFVLRTKCFSVANAQVEIKATCDLKEMRIMGESRVSILAIKRTTSSFDLTWEVAQKKRNRFDVLNFLTFILPTLTGAFAGDTGYRYETAEQPLQLIAVPVDIEVKATSVEFIRGERKEKAFGGTVANYANEYLSFGVGAAVRKNDDVSLDLSANSLTAKDVSKLKTYALLDFHFERIDPFSPKRWSLPFVTAGIEVNTEQFNYGVGAAWRLPFIKNTSIGILRIHALPDQTENAKGAASASKPAGLRLDERTWKTAYVVHYVFPLPKADKK